MGEFFTDYAAQNGMIGIAMTNGPAALAPDRGKESNLGQIRLRCLCLLKNIGQFRLIWRPVLLQEEK